MLGKEKQPLEGSFDPSRQLEKLDKIFAQSIEEQGVVGDEWENVDEMTAASTSSDISEQFILLEESRKIKQKKKDKKEKNTPSLMIPEDEESVIVIPALEGEEEADEQRALTSYDEYDRLFDELNHTEKKLKKERDMFRAEFRFINAACCLLCIFGVFAYLLFAQRESGFINSENRMLAKMPSLSRETYLDGSFAKEMTTYFTDTVPDREKLKRLSAKLTSHYGLTDEVTISGNLKTVKREVLDEPERVVTKATANINIAAAAAQTEQTEKNEAKTKTEKKTVTAVKETAKPVELDDGRVFGSVIVAGKGKNVRAVSAFYGTFENSEKYAKVINKYKSELGGSVNVYSMPIPISSAFYIPRNYEDVVASQPDNIAVMDRTFKDVISVDVYSELIRHTDEYIYSRTDHHWQPLGAYYAGKVFADIAGIDYPELSEYGKYFKENFCGTMYMYSDYNEELKKNPDTFTYYKPKNDYTTYYYNTDFTGKTESTLFFDYAEGVNTYSVFMGKDETICRIDTDVKNGRTLVIFKDSFGNALVPFMVGGFEHIYVCDFRYFDVNAIDFVKKVNCTDLLFAISISSMDTPTHITKLDNDRIQ